MSKKKKEEKRKDKKKKNEKKGTLKSAILSMLDDGSGKAYSLKHVVKKLGLKKKDDIKAAGLILDKLQDDERTEVNNGSNKSSRTQEEVTGIVDHVSSRFAYIRLGGEKEDIFIKGKDLAGAIDGDTVSIVILSTRHGDHEEGKVMKVLKRNRTRFVGKVEVSKNFAFVVPDYRKMHTDFSCIPKI